VIALLAVVVGGALAWVGTTRLRTSQEALAIPALPNLDAMPAMAADAIRAADREARRNPGSGEAIGELAMAYHANTLDRAADEIYALAEARDPDDPRWPYYRGMIGLTIGDNQAAISGLERAVVIRPDLAHGWARLGQLYFTSSRPDDAEAAFRKALELMPTQPHAAVGLGRVVGRRGDWAGAARMLEGTVRANPSFGPAHRMLALAYEALGRTEAQRIHEKLGSSIGLEMRDPLMFDLYLRSSTGFLLVMQAKIAETWGDRVRSEELIRRSLEVAPDDPDVLLAAGRFLANPASGDRSKLEEARALLRRAMEISPDYLNIHHDLAMATQALGDTLAAERLWTGLLERDDEHAMAWMSLGQIAHLRGQHDLARERYAKGLAVPADTPYSLGDPALGHHRFALAAASGGDPRGAERAFRAAQAEKPSFADAWIDHARFLASQGRTEEVIPLYEEAVARAPVEAKLRLSYGNHLLQAGAWDAAREQLAVGVRLAPDDARMHAALGYVVLRAGDAAGAIGHLETALQNDPGFALGHLHLGNALASEGRRDEAARHYQTAINLNPRLRAAQDALRRLESGQ
jgi:tetratricopeptide (TPR) repeat protein